MTQGRKWEQKSRSCRGTGEQIDGEEVTPLLRLSFLPRRGSLPMGQLHKHHAPSAQALGVKITLGPKDNSKEWRPALSELVCGFNPSQPRSASSRQVTTAKQGRGREREARSSS